MFCKMENNRDVPHQIRVRRLTISLNQLQNVYQDDCFDLKLKSSASVARCWNQSALPDMKGLGILVLTQDETERAVCIERKVARGQDDEGLFGSPRFSSVEQPSVRKSLLKP